MTFLSYNTGQITYVVCPTCHAFNTRPFTHDCNKGYTRFLKRCPCSTCKEFRTWLSQQVPEN